jgi:hypothetical protein
MASETRGDIKTRSDKWGINPRVDSCTIILTELSNEPSPLRALMHAAARRFSSGLIGFSSGWGSLERVFKAHLL